MDRTRRQLLGAKAAVLATSALASAPRIQAIAFDAFPIFDPRRIAAACERVFPGQGAALITAWRARQFDYQWLRALGGRYADFWQCTADALAAACAASGVEATSAQRAELMQEWLELDPWPDVPAALEALRSQGLRLALLSNATPRILESGLRRARLGPFFEHVISTDRARVFKPAPRAYQLGTETLKLPRGEILFVGFAGWDVAGARWFGYPTFWNNRANAPQEHLDAVPGGTGATLADLLQFIGNK